MGTRSRATIILVLLLLVDFALWWYSDLPILVVLFVLLLFLLLLGVALRSIPLTDQMVVFRFGHVVGVRGPGLTLLLPLIETGIPIDIRPRAQKIEHLSCVTQDNVPIDMNLAVVWRAHDPVLYIMKATEDVNSVLRALLDGMLRESIAGYPLDFVLTHTADIRRRLEREASDQMQDWGIEIAEIEVVDRIGIPDEVQEAIHREAAAQRDSKAIRHKAEAEAYALQIYHEVAKKIDERALKLRYLTVLELLGTAESTKYVLSVEPSELLGSWTGQVPPKGRVQQGEPST